VPLDILELDGRVHQRGSFNSGNAGRDRYLRQFAGQHAKLGFSRTFVLLDSDLPEEIIGFYSLSAAQVDLVIVDADSDAAVQFYRHFGFTPCNSEGKVLYLALGM
jgi:hypothetical protein